MPIWFEETTGPWPIFQPVTYVLWLQGCTVKYLTSKPLTAVRLVWLINLDIADSAKRSRVHSASVVPVGRSG